MTESLMNVSGVNRINKSWLTDSLRLNKVTWSHSGNNCVLVAFLLLLC